MAGAQNEGQATGDEAGGVGRPRRRAGYGKEFKFHSLCNGKTLEGFKPDRERENKGWRWGIGSASKRTLEDSGCGRKMAL